MATSKDVVRLAAGGVLVVGGTGAGALLTRAGALDTSAVTPQATFTVTNTADTGAGSLRQAIADANAAAGADEITFDPSVTGTITLTSGELAISDSVTISGPGSDVLTVSGNSASRVFFSNGTGDITISGLGIAYGSSGNGAAFRAEQTGSVTLDGVDIHDNAVTQWGALYLRNTGAVSISNSTMTGNSSSGSIAGIYTRWNVTSVQISDTIFTGNTCNGSVLNLYSSGEITLDGVTADSNSSVDPNSGSPLIWISAGTTGSVLNSTFSNNTGAAPTGKRMLAFWGGGSRQGLIANSTITGNSNMSGGVWIGSTLALSIDQSTITGNAGPELIAGNNSTIDISGSVVSDGQANDLAAESAFVVNSDHSALGGADAAVTVNDLGGTLRDVADLGLGALANNGGSTMTMLPLTGSPLIDAGPDPVATFPGNSFDQRGSGYARVSGASADIGAVELQAPTLTAVEPAEGPVQGGTAVTLTGSNFIDGMTVTVGGFDCSLVVVVSSTSATCVTPGGEAGAVDVAITTDNGSASLTGAFTYVASDEPVVPEFTG